MRTNAFFPVLWNRLDRLQNEMNRFFGNWHENLGWATFPPVNVWEENEVFHVEAELPGVKEGDVHVAIKQRNQLHIEGERKGEEGLEGTWHRRERGAARFARALELPAPVEADKVEAKLENGVLYLTLPKAEEARPRRIQVKAE
jgi:HSP20 family protein